jgi:hypothetical protein
VDVFQDLRELPAKQNVLVTESVSNCEVVLGARRKSVPVLFIKFPIKTSRVESASNKWLLE